MSEAYAEVMRIIGEKDSTPEQEGIIQGVTSEFVEYDQEYGMLLRAAEILVDNPATDSTALGRIRRLSNIFSQDELDEKIGLLVDVIFSRGGISA